MKFLLDASALLAYLLAEPEADKVEKLLFMRDGGEPACAVSSAAWVEILGCFKRVGVPASQVHEQLADARHLPIVTLWPDEEILQAMMDIRAQGYFPFADCLTAATAKARDLILVHKDDHFAKLDYPIKQTKL